MISENLEDFVDKVKSVPVLASSAGLAIGGKATDPGLLKIPLPAAWIMYTSDNPDEPPYGRGGEQPGMVPAVEVLLATVSVLVYLPYTTQDDLLQNQFPVLESVVKAIRGTTAPSGHRWRYIGQRLAFVYPDRIAYEQHYTLTAIM